MGANIFSAIFTLFEYILIIIYFYQKTLQKLPCKFVWGELANPKKISEKHNVKAKFLLILEFIFLLYHYCKE